MMEEHDMNVFDVHAIGWVATRDLFSDGVRRLLGLASRFDNAALDRLGKRWATLGASVADDQRAAGLVARILQPRRVPLSARSVAALRAFAEELAAAAPLLYSRAALRERCLSRCINFLGSVLACIVLGHYASPALPLVDSAMLSFFLLACWSLATAAQLFTSLKVVGSLASGKPREDQQTGVAERRPREHPWPGNDRRRELPGRPKDPTPR